MPEKRHRQSGASQLDDGWKHLPETDEEYEGNAGDQRPDFRGSGDLGQDDIDIASEPKG
jgi:hypothetical protein